jgi:D-serine deaminase-like pyridoxal phosphate-dependent protein
MALLVEQRDLLLLDGMPCEIVSAGGTGSYQFTADCPGVTELQPGGGIFADPFYTLQCGVVGLQPALTLLATVTSRPRLERAVTDAGRKSLNWDLQPPLVKGTVEGRPLPDAEVTHLSAEHGILKLGPQSQDLEIGDKIELTPGYSDFTTCLHDEFHGLRDGRVEVVWPIAARGKLR